MCWFIALPWICVVFVHFSFSVFMMFSVFLSCTQGLPGPPGPPGEGGKPGDQVGAHFGETN